MQRRHQLLLAHLPILDRPVGPHAYARLARVGEQGQEEPEMVQHPGVWAERREGGDDDAGEGVWRGE